MVKPSVVWPVEHDEALRRLIGEKLSFSQIAEKLSGAFYPKDFTRNMCCGRAHRLGIQQKPESAKAKTERAARISEGRKNGSQKKLAPMLRENPKPHPRQFVCDPATGLRVADVVPLHVALIDLQPGQCRWPYGDGPYTFCGCEQFAGSSYCEPHASLSQGLGTRTEQMALRFPRAA